MGLAIGEVARRAGCSVPTIRYYEDVGLLAPAERGANGRRVYGFPDVAKLRFIRRARDFGMSVGQVRELVGAERRSGRRCEPARSIVAARLEEVSRRKVELERLRTSLEGMLSRCDAECRHHDDCCTIFDELGRGDA